LCTTLRSDLALTTSANIGIIEPSARTTCARSTQQKVFHNKFAISRRERLLAELTM
jgi:hypothetical protein